VHSHFVIYPVFRNKSQQSCVFMEGDSMPSWCAGCCVDLGVMFAVLETDVLLVQLAMEREEEDLSVTMCLIRELKG
jgi:hypothetical protein